MSKKEKAKKRKKQQQARRTQEKNENTASPSVFPGQKSLDHAGSPKLNHLSPHWQEFYRRVMKQVKEM